MNANRFSSYKNDPDTNTWDGDDIDDNGTADDGSGYIDLVDDDNDNDAQSE